jgi:hypothetical protein
MNKKLGYYVCDGIEFESKIQAAIHSAKVNKPIKWIFNDEHFKAFDWKTEPELTLDQLYDQRSRQLREDYDYLILSYSGGSDSHNIYESFRRQGLHIDEIIVNTMERASEKLITVNESNKDSYNGPLAEHKLQTVKRLEEIRLQMPLTKITELDLSECLFETFEKAKDASWVLDRREGLNPIGMTRFNYLHFTDVRKKFDKDKRIAIILGIEKPRTMIWEGKLVLIFSDRNTNITTVADHFKEYPNSNVEFFYWAPEAMAILSKQGHIIKRWLEAFPDKQPGWTSKTITPSIFRLVHEPLLRDIIYSTWNQNWYQADKAVSDWYSEFDRWFMDHYSNTEAFRVWKDGINFVQNNVSKDFLRMNSKGRADGLQMFRHYYDLGPMKVLHPTLIAQYSINDKESL